jgi:hypothetical protein
VAALFTPPPSAPEAAPPRVTGRFFGVTIPSDIIFFDGRFLEASPTPPAPWGELCFSRSAYAMGLHWGWGEGRDCHPRGISGHTNACEARWASITASWFRRLIAAYRETEGSSCRTVSNHPVNGLA